MRKRSTVRALLVLLVLAIVAGCILSRGGPGVLVLEAQSVPVVLRVQWDPNAATENVSQYRVTLDGGAPITVGPVVDPACACVQSPITVATFGAHTVSVVAVNLGLSDDPASAQVSDPTSISFTLNPPPGAVKGGKIKK